MRAIKPTFKVKFKMFIQEFEKQFTIQHHIFVGKDLVKVTLQSKTSIFHYDVLMTKKEYKKLVCYIIDKESLL